MTARFVGWLFLVIILTFATSFFIFGIRFDEPRFTAVVSGVVLAVSNAILGFIITRWAFGKPMKVFLTALFGSIGFRMLLVGVIVVLVIVLLQLDLKVFLVSFGVLYVIFQVIELFFIGRFKKLKSEI